MALILNIETATSVCSVALSENGKLICFKENNEGQSHARLLTTLIRECIAEAGLSLNNLDAIAVSKGPGSFTGLRIGVSTAKGLCYSLDKPLVSVNTLLSMAALFKGIHQPGSDMLLCPMIDARRMEVYTAIFDFKLDFLLETSAKIIDNDSFTDFLNASDIAFFGDGAAKTIKILEKQENARFFTGFQPSARGMVGFSEDSYNKNLLESVAYFEPFYLKDFYSPRQPM